MAEDRNASVPRYPIESVNNALRLLELLPRRDGMRVSDIAVELGIAASTAHRILAQMEHQDFVVQDTTSRLYRPGASLLRLAERISPNHPGGYARSVMQRLASVVKETVSLQLLNGTETLFLDSVESPRMVRVSSRAGAVLPAHCISGGKVLLAELPTDEITRRYPSAALSGLTVNSIRNRDLLLSELEGIRARGYATNFSESEDGLSGVAVAIRIRAGVAPRALAIAVPRGTIPPRQIDELVIALHDAATMLSDELGLSVRGVGDDPVLA